MVRFLATCVVFLYYHWKTWHWVWLSVLVTTVMLLIMLLVMVMVMIFVAVMMSSPSPSPATQPRWLQNREKETSGRSSVRYFWRRQIDIREQRRAHRQSNYWVTEYCNPAGLMCSFLFSDSWWFMVGLSPISTIDSLYINHPQMGCLWHCYTRIKLFMTVMCAPCFGAATAKWEPFSLASQRPAPKREKLI